MEPMYLGTALSRAIYDNEAGWDEEDFPGVGKFRLAIYKEALQACSFLLERRHTKEVAAIASGWFDKGSFVSPQGLVSSVLKVSAEVLARLGVLGVVYSEKESVEYHVEVLKQVFKLYDKHGLAWDDHLVEQYQNLTNLLHQMTSGSGDDEKEKGWVHRTYVYAASSGPMDTGQVVLRSCRNMLEGNTGCHAWDAAFALFEFILNRPEEFRGRRVVELGSGCGLLGMALASPSCAPGWGYSGEGGLAREVVLSDSSEQALANLSHNLRMNGLRPKRILSDDNDDHDSGGEEEVEGYSPYDDLTEDVFVSHLDWGSVAAEAKENRVGALGGFFRGSRSVEQQQDDDDDVDVDADGLVVVGSDITYDDAIIPDLAKVIKHLLSLSPSPSGTSRDPNNKTKTKSSKAYISAVPRNPATLELFEATVKGLGMSIDLVPDVHEEDMKANMIQASSDEEKKKEKRTRKRPCYRFVGSDLQQQARKSVKLYEIRLM